MRFREAVGAEALDLAEAAVGEVFRYAVPRHARGEFLAELPDGADMAEGRHGAAQPIGLVGGEFGGNNGQLHRLFLEQGNAQRFLQHIFQFILGVRQGRLGKFEDLFGIKLLLSATDHYAPAVPTIPTAVSLAVTRRGQNRRGLR